MKGPSPVRAGSPPSQFGVAWVLVALAAFVPVAFVPVASAQLGSSPARGAFDPVALAAELQRAVVRIEVEKVSGGASGATGFVIGEDGLVITNYHVIDGAKSARVVDGRGQLHEVAGSLAIDEKNDVVILKAEGTFGHALRLGRSRNLVQGEPVAVYGGPQGIEATLTTGYVSALHVGPKERPPLKEGQRVIQLTAGATYGSSGSPVVGADGAVVGVVTSGMSGVDFLTMAAEVEVVHELLATLGDPPVLTGLPGRHAYWWALLASAAFAVALALVFRWLRKHDARRGLHR